MRCTLFRMRFAFGSSALQKAHVITSGRVGSGLLPDAVQNIVNSIIPKQEQLDAKMKLLLAHFEAAELPDSKRISITINSGNALKEEEQSCR